MNHYEQKQQARRERYEELAEKNQAASEASFQGACDATAGIPFGQPILVGHHSEGRHRAALNRSDNRMRKGCELSDKAKYYADKAAGVGKAGISSDDPEAIKKLRIKLNNLERDQKTMKAINAAWRKEGKPQPDEQPKWQNIADAVGMADNDLNRLRLDMARDPLDRAPFTYQLSNNNGNMKRIRERIEQLQQAPTETTEEQHGDVTVIHNTEENRIQLIFPGKPSAEIRSILKSNGFRWSPYNTAWQRHLNNAGIYAAEQALAKIEVIHE